MDEIMLERFVDEFRLKLRDLIADAADLPASYHAIRVTLRETEKEFERLYQLVHSKRLYERS